MPHLEKSIVCVQVYMDRKSNNKNSNNTNHQRDIETVQHNVQHWTYLVTHGHELYIL